MADVRDGVGPYLYVFLKGGLHWQSGEIGIDMPDKSGIDKTHNDRTEVRTVG